MKKYFVLIILQIILVQLTVFGQKNDSLPRITLNTGEECYVYIVQPKDGFLSLERKFDVKQDEIIKLNPILAKGLKIGQKIYIPIKKTDENNSSIKFQNHFVEKGQTIFSICEKYYLSADDLIGYNTFLNDGLKAGQTLRIPIYPASELQDNQYYILHKVEKGQTIYSLCKKYKVSEQELIIKNPFLKNGLKTGQTIRIPLEKKKETELVKETEVNITLEKDTAKNVSIKNIEKANQYTIIRADSTIQIVDTSKQRILFFGDSMIETLGDRMKRYAAENGHELLNIVWYSASTKTYAQHIDTLSYFINQFKPTYIFICLGANELFVRDLEQRDYYTKVIIQKIDTIPYFWIGPPNWRDDTGINDVIHNNVGDRNFFLSKNLKFRRTRDGAHVTLTSAAEWLDTAIAYFNENTPVKIPMNLPKNNNNVKGKNVLLAPLKY